MIEEPRPSLLDTGTRWQHYSELRDLFATGIEILKHVHVKSAADQKKRAQLEGAVELLDARIDLLADFHFQTTYGSKLRKVIDNDVDDIYENMKLDREEAEDAAKNKAKPQDDNSEGPEAYTTK
jgi:4-hydroxy-3-methylbut-2-en-1-yl diphosphate synthase IspG/GcpE